MNNDDIDTGPNNGLWLYCKESFDIDQLTLFVQELIRRFMPDYIFVMTTAETCSKPRVGEFGGGWLAISKDEVIAGNTWSSVKVHAEALRTGSVGPEISDE